MKTEEHLNRPDCITQEHLDFLDELRESGETNMFGAAAYIIDEFDCDRAVAQEILRYWMATFNERHPA